MIAILAAAVQTPPLRVELKVTSPVASGDTVLVRLTAVNDSEKPVVTVKRVPDPNANG